MPGFPSLFLVYGPNTNTSGGSIIFYEEAQAAYIRQRARAGARARRGAIEVRPEVEEASDHELQARFDGTAWVACRSWYREDGDGRIVANWPGYMREYRRRLAELDPREYSSCTRSGARARRVDRSVSGGVLSPAKPSGTARGRGMRPPR